MKPKRIKIEKNSYVWEAQEIKGIHEAAMKYEVSLTIPKQTKAERKIIAFKSADVMDQVEELKRGLPARIVDELSKDLEVSRKELARIAGVAERTLVRKIQEGRLSPDQSERMARVARLYVRAIEVLGSRKHALRWLKTSRAQLKGKPPVDFADTELGCQELMNLLGRIEHGVFS